MSPSVVVVSAAGDVADYAELVSGMRTRLRGWRVAFAGADGSISSAEISAIHAPVIIVPAEGLRFTVDDGVGQILSHADAHQRRVYFRCSCPARMPEVAELPEQLKWFHSINAISLGAENIGETATRLADAIRNTATLEEPVVPVSLLTNSLRLGYRPMIVGPLWEALVITVSVASAIALAVAVPWIRTTRMRFGAFGIASLWAGNVLWGGFIGRRLGSWGAAAGAAIGAVLPWLPLGLASTTMIVAGIISSLFEDAADAYSVRATGAAMLGVPLAIGLTLLSAGRVAARGRSRRDESHWHPDSYQSLALGIAGLALGGSVGWIASSGPIGPPGWYELLAAPLHTITVGILMGFMRGA